MQLSARLSRIFLRKSAQPPVIPVNDLLFPQLEQHDDGTLTVAGTDISAQVETHPSGLTVMAMGGAARYNPHVLDITACNAPYDDDYRRDMLVRLTDVFGFEFPKAMPFLKEYEAGFVFDGEPDFKLPKGWHMIPEERNESFELLDERGRTRGRYEPRRERWNGMIEPEFWFHPRISFENHIVASIHWKKQIDENSFESSVFPYFMPSVRMGRQDILPCFAYAHPLMWPIEYCDFTRINREYDRIEEAERFIAQETKKMFAGAFIECGTDYALIGDGREVMRMGIPLKGDIFAHWDDGVEGQMDELRAILQARVPQILGADNSLVLCTFPTPEKIADIKANVPFYNPPSPKTWQKPVLAGLKAIHRLRYGG